MPTRSGEIRLDRDPTDLKGGSAPVTISTDTPIPVEREGYQYWETLSHAPEAVDLSNQPLPLLEGHQVEPVPIGVIGALRLEGGRLRGQLTMGQTTRARELWKDIRAGVIRAVSIGYEILAQRPAGENEVLVTRWRPYETSLVGVPADAQTGIYRSKGRATMPDENTTSEPTEAPEQPTITTRGVRGGLSPSAKKERTRVQSIGQLANIHGKTGLGMRAVTEGWSIDKFRQAVLDEYEAEDGGDIDIGPPLSAVSGTRGRLGLSHREMGEYSLLRALRVMSQPGAPRHGLEFDISQDLERSSGKTTAGILVPMEALTIQRGKRVVTTGPGVGGELVPTIQRDDLFIDALRARSEVLQRATVLQGLVGTVTIPAKQTPAATGWYNLDHTDSIAEDSFTTREVTLSANSVAALSTMSHDVFVQSSMDVEALIRDDLAAGIAVEIDRVTYQGTGTGNQPTGLLTLAGTQNNFGTGTTPDLADIVGLESALAGANALMGTLGYVSDPATSALMKQAFIDTGSGITLWSGSAVDGNMNGYGAFSTNNLPAESVLFLNWSDVLVGMWGQIELLTDPFRGADGNNFVRGSVSVRAIADIDVQVRHALSVASLTGQ